MADTGYNYGALTHFEISAADVDGTAIADGAVATCDLVDQDGTVGTTVVVSIIEDNTGACDGNFIISLLGTDLDPDGESYQAGPTTGSVFTDVVWSTIIDPVQNTTRTCPPFFVSALDYPKYKLHFLNDAGQEVTVTANFVVHTVPVAS